jgi:Flp pilus assembly pilin Flp
MPKKSQLRPIMALLRARLAADEQGATAIEYALTASGVGAAVAATVYNLGSATQGLYSHLSSMF